MGARQSEAVSGRGPLSSPTPPPAQPGKGQGCPLQAPPRAAAHSCRGGLQPLGSEIGGHPADEEEENLLMRMRIQISWSAILLWYLESFLSLSVINIPSCR